MRTLLQSGRVLDWILAAMLLEGLGLALLYRLVRRGVAPSALWPNLAAGMCLLLAMRLNAAGVWWGYVSSALLGALCFHVAELRRNWT